MTELRDPATSFSIERVFNAKRDRVYAAFTTPELLRQWWRPDGYHFTHLEMDARPGKTWKSVMVSDAGDFTWTSKGKFDEVISGERLVWRVIGSPDDSDDGHETRVTLTFDDDPAGTRVTLTHEQFPDPETRDHHQGGWGTCLDKLARLFDSGRI